MPPPPHLPPPLSLYSVAYLQKSITPSAIPSSISHIPKPPSHPVILSYFTPFLHPIPTIVSLSLSTPLLPHLSYPATLPLAELSAIWELVIHLVSPTTVLACGRRPTSFTVIIRWRDDLSMRTASSCGMPRKLRPFTSRIWSPTCGAGRA